MYRITCYNGTVWESKTNDNIWETIEKFIKETGLHGMDIRLIENLH
ncbi:MAG: hypothetical protein WC055_00075 [Melioribacteraceae bacterium]